MGYQVNALDCWKKVKELRTKHYEDIFKAKEKGKLLVTGGAAACFEILSGLGDYEYFQGEPYGATVGCFPDLSVEYSQAAEERGYARDLCAYMRLYWGSMFLNKSPFGEFPKPDFAFQYHMCDSHVKWFQVVSEHMGIPFFCIEAPQFAHGKLADSHIRYLASQLHEFIDWSEKITKRTYDDKRLIETVINMRHCQALWAQICEMNKNVPAPLEQKTMYSLYLPAVQLRAKKEAVDFYKELKDEVAYRVANQIGAMSEEKCRLMHDNIPPWYALYIFRHCAEYGAIFVGSPYCFAWGAWDFGEDGETARPAKTLEELNQVPKNRDEAIQYLATHYSREGDFWSSTGRVRAALWVAQGWKVNGAIYHLNRGCEGLSMGQMECILALKNKMGLPAIGYESNSSDKREWSEPYVISQLDSFLESLGLKRK
ncbi:MAG: 2-hydroxyacyl-CoA dehydratase family protein [Thermodesulfobacteriota bacterium]|nr:2-hydroxyacyl-CoA dehydratase family protein [Thermodesulfobacteriota bacterium]